jgi:hypothetical protein
MNTSLKLLLVLLTIILCRPFNGKAQTVQYVTLYAHTATRPFDQYSLQTNQIVSLVGSSFANGTSPGPNFYGRFSDGEGISVLPQFPGSVQIITGLTNIYLGLAGQGATWATFQITTPAAANVISNYVPADAIVIPASATGNVQIILESSMDLLNWTAANPGTYSASSATNRFFRVRAVHN